VSTDIVNSFSANSTPKVSSELEMEIDFDDLPVQPARVEDKLDKIKGLYAVGRGSAEFDASLILST